MKVVKIKRSGSAPCFMNQFSLLLIIAKHDCYFKDSMIHMYTKKMF